MNLVRQELRCKAIIGAIPASTRDGYHEYLSSQDNIRIGDAIGSCNLWISDESRVILVGNNGEGITRNNGIIDGGDGASLVKATAS